jgi:hypothetical protein
MALNKQLCETVHRVAVGHDQEHPALTRDDAAGRDRANNDNVVSFLEHQCVSLSHHLYRSINTRSRRRVIAVPDSKIDWTMLLENDLARPAGEITSRHRVDKRSLLPLTARRDVARNATSRMALEADVVILFNCLRRDGDQRSSTCLD